MIANQDAARDFINACYNSPRPLVTYWDLQRSIKGLIEFRVPKSRFTTRDTEKPVLERLRTNLGHPTESGQNGDFWYRWWFTDTRYLELAWLQNKGTYVRLIDLEYKK